MNNTNNWQEVFQQDLAQEDYHTRYLAGQLTKEEKEQLDYTQKLFAEDTTDLFMPT